MYLRNIEDSLAAWPPLARLGVTRRDFLRFTTIAGSGLTLGATISAVAGKSITTIEGLAGEAGKAVQTAWVSLDVPQCGYCQSGQIMSAAALLAGNAKPTDADIDAAMAGNICRCATYARIRAAIHQAADSLPASRAKS